ncbi:MAG: hypothetical protein CL908_25015 [Deltaproteobacteria bacterium]|nr:hypothetical protein [Deltaproteobacteria bacterium]
MARRDRLRVSLFPFMSVLACTIGALTLLLTAMSLSAVGAHGDSERAYARSLAEVEADRASIEAERRALAQADRAWVEVDTALAARGLSSGLSRASIEREIERVEDHSRLVSSLARVEQALREVSRERDAVETTLEVLESRRETLPILIDPTGLSRHLKPFFVECDEGGATAYRASDALRYFVPLESLSPGGDYGRYLRRVAATPGALLVLLVRPDGLATSRRAESIARGAGVRVARLPLPGGGELDWSLLRIAEGVP